MHLDRDDEGVEALVAFGEVDVDDVGALRERGGSSMVTALPVKGKATRISNNAALVMDATRVRPWESRKDTIAPARRTWPI